MKKLIVCLLIMALVIPAAMAEHTLTHYQTRYAFDIDYPADLFTLVSEDGNITLRAADESKTAVIDFVCEKELSPDPVQKLMDFAAELQLDVSKDDIDVFTTNGNGTAYRLRIVDDEFIECDYVIQQGDREWWAGILLDVDVAACEDAAHAVVLSVRINPDMLYVYPEDEWDEYEGSFYDDMLNDYDPVLVLYAQAITEGWDAQRLMDNHLCTLLALHDDPAALAQQIHIDFVDLEGNGVYSLILFTYGANDDSSIDLLGVYTKNGDTITADALSSERSLYSLCLNEDGRYVLINCASSSAFQSGYFIYGMENGQLKLIQAIMFDASENEEGRWYLAHDEDWDVTNDLPITEEEAFALLDEYKPAESDFGFTLHDYIELFTSFEFENG